MAATRYPKNPREAVELAIETRKWVTVPCAHPGDTIRLLVTQLTRAGCTDFRFKINNPRRASVSFMLSGR